MDAIATFRIKPEMLDLIDEHARRNRHSRSDQLRIIVEDWLMDWTDPDTHTPRQTWEEFLAGKVLVDTPADYDTEAS